jgi:hypothetical protein
MRAGAPYGTTRKITKLTKMRSGTKKALKSIFGKKETYSPVRMDVESPATCKGTLTLKDDEDALEGWGAMDEEETIVPKEFLEDPRDLPPVPPDYTPPKIHKALSIHGASINERFTLPPNIELVIFSRRGLPIWDGMISNMLNWIRKNYAELMNSDMKKYHLKTFIQKGVKDDKFFKNCAMNYWQARPHYSTSRRFNLNKVYTATMQIFRGGQLCPDIILQNDALGGKGLGGTAGFWDIGKKGEGDVVIPLKKDDTSTESSKKSSTESLLEAFPFPNKISLKDLLNLNAFRNAGHLRLYLFCCRVEEKGQEASNSQASDASQSKKGYITKEGEVTHAQSKRLRSKGKRSLSSSFSRLVSKSRR